LREKPGGCKQCREDHEFLHTGPPPCGACDPPELLPGNQEAWQVVEACDLALTDGLGGVSLTNLRQVAEALDVPWEASLIGKLMILARFKTGENLKDLLEDSELEDSELGASEQ